MSFAAARWAKRVRQIVGSREELHAMRARIAQAARAQWSWDASAAALAAALRAAVNAG